MTPPDPDKAAAWFAYAIATGAGSLFGMAVVALIAVHVFGVEWQEFETSAYICFGFWLGNAMRGPRE